MNAHLPERVSCLPNVPPEEKTRVFLPALPLASHVTLEAASSLLPETTTQAPGHFCTWREDSRPGSSLNPVWYCGPAFPCVLEPRIFYYLCPQVISEISEYT